MSRHSQKKSRFRLSLAVSLPLFLGVAGCAQLQGVVQGVPLGSTQVASFTTSQGQQVNIMQLPGAMQYDFYAPGTPWQALNLPMLQGMSNITFLGSQALGADTAVFLQAADNTCQDRHILLVVNLPSVQSNIFSGCDSSLTMVPQADGTSLGFRNAEAMPPYHYVYRDGVMYGPISERIEIPHVRRHYVRKKTTSTASSSAPTAPPAEAPVNLDQLDVPANAPAVNLDK